MSSPVVIVMDIGCGLRTAVVVNRSANIGVVFVICNVDADDIIN